MIVAGGWNLCSLLRSNGFVFCQRKAEAESKDHKLGLWRLHLCRSDEFNWTQSRDKDKTNCSYQKGPRYDRNVGHRSKSYNMFNKTKMAPCRIFWHALIREKEHTENTKHGQRVMGHEKNIKSEIFLARHEPLTSKLYGLLKKRALPPWSDFQRTLPNGENYYIFLRNYFRWVWLLRTKHPVLPAPPEMNWKFSCFLKASKPRNMRNNSAHFLKSASHHPKSAAGT